MVLKDVQLQAASNGYSLHSARALPDACSPLLGWAAASTVACTMHRGQRHSAPGMKSSPWQLCWGVMIYLAIHPAQLDHPSRTLYYESVLVLVHQKSALWTPALHVRSCCVCR